MAQKIFYPTAEWLTFTQSRRVHHLSNLFLQRCSSGGTFWQIRTFFNQKTDNELTKLYDFLYSLTARRTMTLTEAFRESEKHRVKLLEEYDKQQNPETTEYGEYEISDLMNW